MKLFGTLSELVKVVFRSGGRETKLDAATQTGSQTDVTFRLPDLANNSGTAVIAELVEKDLQQTLTNKTLTSPNINGGTIYGAARLDGLEVRKIGDAAGNPTLKFYKDGGGNSLSMYAAPGTGSGVEFVLPPTNGTADYMLRTDGSGTTSWSQVTNNSVASNAAIVDSKLATISTAGKVSNSATTATDANTPSAIVARDASGNFSAGTITATLSGNATNVTGIVAPANGGTGQNFSSSSGLIKASSGTFSAGQASLTADVSGTLPIGNGGTGQTTANAALNALLPSQGSSANKYLKTDGTNTSWAAAAGGSGEVNAILNPSAADGTTGWAAATNYSVTADSSNSPLSPATTTCFALSTTTASAESSTSGISYASFTMPASLRNRKLKIEFFANIPATSAGVWRMSLYDSSNARVALSTDVSSVTTLPGGVNGKFVAYFDATSSATYSLRLTQTTRTSANTLYITNVIVGPGIQPQGAVIGRHESVTSYTILGSTSNPTAGAGATYFRETTRDGSDAIIRFEFSQTTAGSAGSGTYYLPLPSGLSVDTTRIRQASTGFSNSVFAGEGFVQASSTYYNANPQYGTTTAIALFLSNNAADGLDWGSTNAPLSTTGTTRISVTVRVPIAEWAGSGTVQLAQNDVEYAYNTSTSTLVGDTTSFGYGPGGAVIQNITAVGGLDRTVQFQSKIQDGDILTVEIQNSAANSGWIPVVAGSGGVSYNIAYQNGTVYGLGIFSVNNSNNQVVVRFGQYATNIAGYGAAGVAWSGGVGSFKWRVRKSSAGAAVGFGIHQPGVSSGLVSASGLLGQTNGLPIASGYVGQLLEVYSSTSQALTGQAAATYINIPSITLSLTAGVWLVTAEAAVRLNTSSGVTSQSVALSGYSGNTTTDHLVEVNQQEIPGLATLNQDVKGYVPNLVVRCDGTNIYIAGFTVVSTTLYLKIIATGLSSGVQSARGRITAVRIA